MRKIREIVRKERLTKIPEVTNVSKSAHDHYLLAGRGNLIRLTTLSLKSRCGEHMGLVVARGRLADEDHEPQPDER